MLFWFLSWNYGLSKMQLSPKRKQVIANGDCFVGPVISLLAKSENLSRASSQRQIEQTF